MVFALIFIIGLLMGSFLNVVILRFNTGESIITGNSRCFNCSKKLKWNELIPVLSFLSQSGRCSKCGVKISLQYPFVEIITAFVFLIIYIKIYGGFTGVFPGLILNNGFFAPLFFVFPSLAAFSFYAASPFFNLLLFLSAAVFFSILIVISVYDIYHKIIPDSLSYFLSAFSLVYAFFAAMIFSRGDFFVQSVLSGLGLSFLFFAMAFFSREKWMGYGDVKLAFSLGVFLGPSAAFFAFLFSFWTGAIFGIVVLTLGKKFSLKSQISFAPFLALGTFLGFLLNFNFY